MGGRLDLGDCYNNSMVILYINYAAFIFCQCTVKSARTPLKRNLPSIFFIQITVYNPVATDGVMVPADFTT